MFTVFFLLEISEDEAEERLQVAIQDKFSVFGEVCFDWWNKKPLDFIKVALSWEYWSFLWVLLYSSTNKNMSNK